MTYFPSVFISNSEDPRETITIYREHARDAVLEAQMVPIMYRYYRVQYVGGSQLDLSRKMIDESDIFVGFYSGIYGGSIVDERDWAEFEYDYALAQNKPMILLFSHENNAHFPKPDSKFECFKSKIPGFHQKFKDEMHLKAQLTTLLVSANVRSWVRDRLVVNPLFGPPASHPQYEADIFMLMPFESSLKPIYEDVIKPIVEQLGLSIKRGDDFFDTHSIMEEIWSATFYAKTIIADCTGKNANVFYEIGIAHTLGKQFILLTQNRDDIPFDLRQYRYILYSPDDLPALEKCLHDALTQLDLAACD